MLKLFRLLSICLFHVEFLRIYYLYIKADKKIPLSTCVYNAHMYYRKASKHLQYIIFISLKST